MKCEYCKKEIGARESYVVEHWSDVEGVLHKRALHSVNGKNFMDNCYHRFNHGFPKDTIVEIQFPECNRPDPDYDMLIQIKVAHVLKCEHCGYELTTCWLCKNRFNIDDAVLCFNDDNSTEDIYHKHAGCSFIPVLTKAIK